MTFFLNCLVKNSTLSMSEASYLKCGGCFFACESFMDLHFHLTEHIEGGDYTYIHVRKTAFPRSTCVDMTAQTDDVDTRSDETQTEYIPETETDSVPETQTQSVPETQTQSVPETQTQSVPETQTQSVPKTQTQSVLETQTPSLLEIQTQSVPETEKQSLPEIQIQSVPHTLKDPVPETQTQSVSETQTQSVPETQKNSLTESRTESVPEALISIKPQDQNLILKDVRVKLEFLESYNEYKADDAVKLAYAVDEHVEDRVNEGLNTGKEQTRKHGSKEQFNNVNVKTEYVTMDAEVRSQVSRYGRKRKLCKNFGESLGLKCKKKVATSKRNEHKDKVKKGEDGRKKPPKVRKKISVNKNKNENGMKLLISLSNDNATLGSESVARLGSETKAMLKSESDAEARSESESDDAIDYESDDAKRDPDFNPNCKASSKAKQKPKQAQKVEENSKNFPCMMCDKTYTTKNPLELHIEIEHYHVYSSQCDQCYVPFHSELDKITHNCKMSVFTYHKCAFCEDGKKFRFKESIKRHLQEFHENRHPFTCDICEAPLLSTLEQQMHWNRHKDYGSLKSKGHHCLHCDDKKGYKNIQSIAKHIQEEHGGIHPLKCEFCEKPLMSELEKDTHISLYHRQEKKMMKKKEIQNKELICDKCGKIFNKQRRLTSHRLRVCVEKTHTCEICHNKFKSKAALRNHKIIHEKNRRFVCDQCGSSFSHSSSLKVHIKRLHDGERSYKCSYCEKAFPVKSGLTKHELVHTKVKPWPCDQCSRSFTSRWNRKAHMRQHTGDNPYKCGICGLGFKHNVVRKTHEAKCLDDKAQMTGVMKP